MKRLGLYERTGCMKGLGFVLKEWVLYGRTGFYMEGLILYRRLGFIWKDWGFIRTGVT